MSLIDSKAEKYKNLLPSRDSEGPDGVILPNPGFVGVKILSDGDYVFISLFKT
jgi:hypothetical protein